MEPFRFSSDVTIAGEDSAMRTSPLQTDDSIETKLCDFALEWPRISFSDQPGPDWIVANVVPLLRIRFPRAHDMVEEAFLPMRRRNFLIAKFPRKRAFQRFDPPRKRLINIPRNNDEEVQVVRHQHKAPHVKSSLQSNLTKLPKRIIDPVIRKKAPSPLRACRDKI
jgi:hypothetical protein